MGEILHRILEFVTSLGYWGILLGLAIEVIPSEIVLAYAGYLVSQGEINVVEAVIFGTIGCLLQQVLLYAIGLYGGRPFVEKYGRYLHLKPKYIDMTERWFQKYGAGVVFTSRFIPVVRQAISIPAGMARMNMTKFLFYTGLASIPWSILFIELGRALGDNWESIDEKAKPYTQPILLIALAVTALYVLYMIWNKRRGKGVSSGILASGDLPAAEGSAGLPPRETIDSQLARIGEGYQVLEHCEVHYSGGVQQIDRVVIGPGGVFHVEALEELQTLTATKEKDLTAPLYRKEYALKELLRKSGITADVVGVLCRLDPALERVGPSVAGFVNVPVSRLAEAVTGHRTKQPLRAEDVEAIVRELSARTGE